MVRLDLGITANYAWAFLDLTSPQIHVQIGARFLGLSSLVGIAA